MKRGPKSLVMGAMEHKVPFTVAGKWGVSVNLELDYPYRWVIRGMI